MTLDEAWALSVAWYHDRLDESFHSRTFEEAVTIFERLGLTDPFWSFNPPTPTP